MKNLLVAVVVVLSVMASPREPVCQHEWMYSPFASRQAIEDGHITRVCSRCYRVERADMKPWREIRCTACPKCGHILTGDDDEKGKELPLRKE